MRSLMGRMAANKKWDLPLPEAELAGLVDTRLVRKSGTDTCLQINMIEHDKATCKLQL